MNTQGLQKSAQMIGGVLAKNSPTILTGLSVAGLLGTAIMAVRATPKALLILEELENPKNLTDKGMDVDGDVLPDGTYVWMEKGQWRAKPTKLTKIKATWKVYLPAAAMGAITIGCIVGANSINLRRNAALASVYSLSEAALKEYQAKVVETIGKEKERSITDEIKQDRIVKNPLSKNEVIITGTGDTLCYDAQSGRYFKSDRETIVTALNTVSRRLMSDMVMSLSDVYYELGLEGTKTGDILGWHVDWCGNELIQPDFSSSLAEDGRPCLVLDFTTEPRYIGRDC